VSYVFEARGVSVWSPALLVGALYMASTGVLAERAGLDTGLSLMAEDLVVVDPDRHRDFVQGLLGRVNGPVRPDGTRRNYLLWEQVKPIVGASIVMLDRAGVTVRQDDAHLENYVQVLSTKMPT
jgi:hypothetical protein